MICDNDLMTTENFRIRRIRHSASTAHGVQCLSNTYTTNVLNCWSIWNMAPYVLFSRRNVYWWRKSETFGYVHRVDKSKSKQAKLERNMAAPSGQRYPSVTKLLKYTVVLAHQTIVIYPLHGMFLCLCNGCWSNVPATFTYNAC